MEGCADEDGPGGRAGGGVGSNFVGLDICNTPAKRLAMPLVLDTVLGK